MLAGAGNYIGGIVGVVGMIVGITALLYSRRQTKITVRDDARDEAFQLAEVRRQTILDLTARVDGFRKQIAEMEKRHDDQVAAMEVQIANLTLTVQQVREEAADAQRVIAGSVRLSLRNVRSYLEADPPDVTAALHDLRDMLDGDVPKPAPPM